MRHLTTGEYFQGERGMFPQYTNFVRKMRLIPRNKRKPEDGGDISSDVFSEFDFDNWNELDGLISDADLSVTSESISEGRETPVIIDTNRLHVVPDSRTTPPPPLPQRRERPIITLRRSPSRPISPPLEKTPGRIGYEDEARPQTPPPQPEMSLYKVMFGQDEPAEKPKTKLWLGKKKEVPRKKLYAEGVTVETGGNKEVQDLLREWHNILKKHGLRLNPGNSDVMWIGNMMWTYI
ncbi:hypothetical protein LSAT2_029368 [Lamellibrachia satsuma]|nr:hypothetical protein LSAT2_029368 [Lamellibrachia satsuma]